MEYLVGLILGIVGKIVNNEIEAWAPLISKRIIEKAVRCLPQYEQERFREEWLAHLDECPSSVSRLWHAIGCILSSRMLSASLRPENNLHLIGAMTATLGFGACHWSNWFVIVVFVGLFLNWLHEPDVRSGKPDIGRRGFFVDDAENLTAYTLMIVGLGLSPYFTTGSSLLMLSQCLLTRSYNYVIEASCSQEQLGKKPVSVVDLRGLIAVWTLAGACLGSIILTRTFGFYFIDIVFSVISTLSFAGFVNVIRRDIATLRKD
jgi:hypothetical protein